MQCLCIHRPIQMPLVMPVTISCSQKISPKVSKISTPSKNRNPKLRHRGRESSARANLHTAAKRVAWLDDGEAVRWLCQSAQRKLLRPGLFQIRHRPQPVRARKRHQAVPVNDAVRNSLGRRLGPEREAARQLLPMHAVHVHLPAHAQPVLLKIFSL
jgi:hypothetical protein